ncbi:hypothetical protein ACNKHP_14915 [Shigella boydii]
MMLTAGVAHHLTKFVERRAAARCACVKSVLNLANTAEQYHRISPKGEAASNPEVIARTLPINWKTSRNRAETPSKSSGIAVAGTGPHGSPNRNYRRTLIHKMVESSPVKQLNNKDITNYEHNQLMRRLRQLIAQS